MREEHWYKMFFAALLLHAIVIALVSVPFGKVSRRLDMPTYSVHLVTDVGEGPRGPGPKSAAGSERAPVKKEPPTPPKTKPDIKQQTKVKPVPVEKERSIPAKQEKSVKPTKTPDARDETPSTDEVKRLNERIARMRGQTANSAVTNSKEGSTPRGASSGGTGFGSGGEGTGGGSLEEKYRSDVWEKIKESWNVPPLLSMRKDLHMMLTIRVRKDGHIMDWKTDRNSGSRLYDESLIRALRAVEKVPAIPDGLGKDTMELAYDAYPPSAR